MDRRTFLADGAAVAASAMVMPAAGAKPLPPHQELVAVLAELKFTPGTGAQAAEALKELVWATQAEPGCRRYVVARDLADPDRFHLSELWNDPRALADHFATPHMADFSAKARALGYAAPYLKQIKVADVADLKPGELGSLRDAVRDPQPSDKRK